MSFTIRSAEPKDYEAIAALSRDCLGYDCGESIVKERLSSLDSEREAVFVAEAEGSVTGFIHVVRYEPLYYEVMANVLGLAVFPEYRRQGMASALVKSTEQWAREHEIGLVRLNSGKSRTEAHEFYRRTGFDSEKLQVRFIKDLRRPQE